MSDDTLQKLNTGAMSRRFALAKAGAQFGGKALRQKIWQGVLGTSATEGAKQQKQENLDWLVDELGKMKGSVVKVGQILATYGEYMLPPDVTEALHRLEDSTPALAWPVIKATLESELSADLLADLEIDEKAFAAASLAQVHRAVRRSDGVELCVKVQYPGVDKTIDADLNAVITMLKLSSMLDSTLNLEGWLSEMRALLHREVDYDHEREQLELAAKSVAHIAVLKVPKVYSDYCTKRVLVMSWETGHNLASDAVAVLSQERRNRLSRALLDLFLREVFDWNRMQTDPNFGNYLLQIDEQGEQDRLVLLDFGAVRAAPDHFVTHFREMISAAWFRDTDRFIEEALELRFIEAHFPADLKQSIAEVGLDLIEPLQPDLSSVAPEALSENGDYLWRGSQLPKRIAKRALGASLSKHFAVPPTEFMFVIRKLMGVYTLISAMDGQFRSDDLLAPYVRSAAKKTD
jgi:predicted unusual protein kinase regulating ubiquinone biosynthesis (AarF/ABC1/UbiB family)